MADWYSDTNPKVLALYIERQREMSADEKIVAVLRMNAILRTLAEESVRSMYPAAGEREVFLRTAARFLDPETMLRVYGWAPEQGAR
jgi:hypothetical protein